MTTRDGPDEVARRATRRQSAARRRGPSDDTWSVDRAARPPPRQPGRGVVLRLLPAVAEGEHRRRRVLRVELLDVHDARRLAGVGRRRRRSRAWPRGRRPPGRRPARAGTSGTTAARPRRSTTRSRGRRCAPTSAPPARCPRPDAGRRSSSATSPSRRFSQAAIGPRPRPAPSAFATPAVSGVSCQPSPANQPGSLMTIQSRRSGPDAAQEHLARERPRVVRAHHARLRIDEREIGAIGIRQEPHGPAGAALPAFDQRRATRASASRPAPMAGAIGSASTGRANGWCMPTAMPGVVAASARTSASARATGLPPRA